MPDDTTARRLDAVERNGSDLARSVTTLTDELLQLRSRVVVLEDHHQENRVRSAVEIERDKALQSDISNIRSDIQSIKSLGKWALMTFIGAIILGFVSFIIRGGLSP